MSSAIGDSQFQKKNFFSAFFFCLLKHWYSDSKQNTIISFFVFASIETPDTWTHFGVSEIQGNW